MRHVLMSDGLSFTLVSIGQYVRFDFRLRIIFPITKHFPELFALDLYQLEVGLICFERSFSMMILLCWFFRLG